jgi:DNA-binding response OmpR family regulator
MDVSSATTQDAARRRVLLAESDPRLLATLRERLLGEGYEVDSMADGADLLSTVRAGHFDLVVLDLPAGDGPELCRQLRRSVPETALILATAGARVADRVLSLRAGADDYLVKPFDPAELVARVEACLRRRGRRREGPGCHRFGELTVDLARAEVVREGRRVALSARELELLRCLLENAGTVLSRDVLLDRVWGRDAMPIPRTVDVHVAWLRRKLEADPRRPTLIRTIHGVGYVFGPDGAAR